MSPNVPDLKTRYLGLELAHPLVASPSPIAQDLDGVRRLEDEGAAAVVLPSIYEEEVTAELGRARERAGLDRRLELIRRARAACSVPIIASLNGVTPGGWLRFARDIESAGASALELNLYEVPADLDESSQALEGRWRDTVQAVRAATRLPLAVKLSPWLSAPGCFCRSLVAAGVNGLTLFNRFYQPDIDLEALTTISNLQLSGAHEMRHVLLWISLLSGHVDASLAATTGVDTTEHVVKYLLAGADVVMTTSALLRHGPRHLGALRAGLEHWLHSHGFDSLAQLRGRLSAAAQTDRRPLLRAQYKDMLQAYPVRRRRP